MAENITSEELLALAIEARIREMHVAMPARVEKYDVQSQRIDCVPQLQRYVPDGDGDLVTEDLPKLTNVPVIFPRGGGMFMSFPLAAGDFVLLHFCDVPIGAWLQKGEKCEPGDERLHTLAGAVAYAGVYPSAKKLTSASGDNLVIGKDGTPGAQIEITPSEVHLGAGATKGVARSGDHAGVGTLVLTVAGTAVLSGTYTDPDGVPTVISSGTPIPLKAKINESSAHVKAVD